MIKLKLQKGVNAMEIFFQYYINILRGRGKKLVPKVKMLLIPLPYYNTGKRHFFLDFVYFHKLQTDSFYVLATVL